MKVLISTKEKLPSLEKPFAALMAADGFKSLDNEDLARWSKRMLEKGCRYFVCFGHESERLHDQIDEVVVNYNYSEVTTTYHGDEPIEDVVNFFLTCAVGDMKDAIIFSDGFSDWSKYF